MRHSDSVLGKLFGVGGMCLVPLVLSVNVAMAEKAVEPLLAACNTTVTSGSGEGYMGICISSHGNVLQFEGPKGQDHMFEDGYMLVPGGNCAGPDDYGHNETGWAAPNPPVPPNAPLPLTITRSTIDGKFKLVQKFTRNPTTRELTIQMTLTNTSGQSQSVANLVRFMDFDANGTPENDVIDKTRRFVSVHQNVSPNQLGAPVYGMIAAAISPGAYVLSFLHPVTANGGCIPANQATNTPYVSSGNDDIYGAMVFPVGSMAKGTSKVYTMKYQLY